MRHSYLSRTDPCPCLTVIRDRAQVRALCEWALEYDSGDNLGQFFDTPRGMNQEQIQLCIEEEGWILGAK